MKRIRQFMVLAQTLNFRRAAERLHMAQPPLTVSIQKLESDLGVRLFERGGAGGVTLTVAGQAALVEARRLLFHNSQLIATVQATAAGTGGCLRIGFVGSTTHGVLQRIVRQFRADFPAVQLVLKEATSVQIADRVERGELDVGLVRTPLMASAQVRLKPLLTERFVAAVPLGNALTAHAELRMDMLAGEPFVFYTRGDAAGLQAMAMLACQQAGFLPRIAQEATQVQTVLSLVESGLGVALVPSIMQNSPNPGVAYRAIHDIAPAADIGLALLVPEMANPAVPGFQEAALKCFAVG
ncbi:LysR family transcriptional regulator [Corticibacter populi]|nr:LysR family transcriptional regulator [Corticibacter populi]